MGEERERRGRETRTNKRFQSNLLPLSSCLTRFQSSIVCVAVGGESCEWGREEGEKGRRGEGEKEERRLSRRRTGRGTLTLEGVEYGGVCVGCDG